MTNPPKIPTTDDPAVANPAGPDWDLVPFDVPCARCGHDLRGLTDPVCPACKLEFDWSVAVPIEKLTCEKCDYHLFGLTETRCPECGTRFKWTEALDAYRRRQKPLFEYRWRERPVRSLIRTWFMALRPKRFWTELDIHDPPQVLLLLFVLAAWLLAFVFAAAFGAAVYEWFESLWGSGPWRPRPKSVFEIPRLAFEALTDPYSLRMYEVVALWLLISLLSLLIYRQSMRRYRIRFEHVFRAFVYAVPLALPAAPALFPLAFVIAMALLVGGLVRGFGSELVILIVATLVLAVALWSVRCAYAFYLRIPHGAAIAVASQAMSLLLLLLILTLAHGSWIGMFAIRIGL